MLDAGYSMLVVRFRLGATVRTGIRTKAVLPAPSIEHHSSNRRSSKTGITASSIEHHCSNRFSDKIGITASSIEHHCFNRRSSKIGITSIQYPASSIPSQSVAQTKPALRSRAYSLLITL